MEACPKFVQIATAQWGAVDNLNHSVYALGDDGKVYRYEKSLGAWTVLTPRALSKKEEQAKKAARYKPRDERGDGRDPF